MAEVRVLLFDVFGTLVDWRSTLIRKLTRMGRELGLDLDWERFADDWRALYQPSMELVRAGERPWTNLDILHRESLIRLLNEAGTPPLDDAAIDRLNALWHRLDGWPDAAEGLRRLRRRHICAALSNGNVGLMVDVARHAGLVWDAILGAEFVRQYKPRSEVYLAAAEALGTPVANCMMVAAHNHDLAAARALGFQTAFVVRPTEYGPGQTTDLEPEDDWEIVVPSLTALAERLER